MLFNEPKLLKCRPEARGSCICARFSALQRAEIAEIITTIPARRPHTCFSALQRAEIAEMVQAVTEPPNSISFSALQRAEIAEIAKSV